MDPAVVLGVDVGSIAVLVSQTVPDNTIQLCTKEIANLFEKAAPTTFKVCYKF